jgi:hypothetical protein
MKNIRAKLLFFLLLICTLAGAQVPVISIHCDSIPFQKFLRELEQLTQLKYYYDPVWADSVTVSLDMQDRVVKDVLEEALRGTDLSFILMDGRVIFSKNYTIKTDYDRDVINAYASLEDSLLSEKVEYKPLVRETVDASSVNPEFQLHRIGNPAKMSLGDEAVISGYITDIDNGEPLMGAVVYLEAQNIGAATNAYGFYSLRLPKGQFTLEYSYVGMKSTSRKIRLFSDGILNLEMEGEIVSLREVTVTTDGQENVRGLALGMEKISIKQIKQIPMALGEVDIIRSVTLLPGVQSAGEGTTGINVRGGSTDQNLILFDRAPIMNPSHFVGFFSSINADLLKDATLYKSSIPAQYGGRISSVFDMQTREGNKKEIKGGGGISPVMSKLMLEGPISGNKSSFLIGARSSYSNWILKYLPDEKLKRSNVFFMDLNGKLTFDLNEKNSLYASGYYSRDHFEYFTETDYSYRNAAATLTWKNILSNKLFSLYSLVYSGYRYETTNLLDSISSSEMDYSIAQYKADAEYTWYPSYNHKVRFGMNAIYYNMNPGSLRPFGQNSTVRSIDLETEKALETAFFYSSEYDINPNITISAGIRFSSFLAFGPQTQYQYEDSEDRTLKNISDTIYYGSGDVIASSFNPEPRLSVRFSFDNRTSLKLGYTRMVQYLHMLSNTAAIAPTDTWKLSDTYLKPQVGDQIGVGFYRNFLRNSLETSMELYYRRLNNILDYVGGAELVMNEHIETDVINGNGKAWGVELMVKKTKGKLTGWISYSYSRIFHRIDSKNHETRVNEGNYYPASYDKPNNLSLVGNYRLSRRVSISTIVDYSDGRPVTFPLASFQYLGSERLQYSGRNDFRIPYYFRWDLSITFEGNLKTKKLAHSSLTLGLYNVTGRRNAYSVFFRTEAGIVKGYQLSVFGEPIPTITYNFRF